MRITSNPYKLQLVKEETEYSIDDIVIEDDKITLKLEDGYLLTFNKGSGFLDRSGTNNDLDILLNKEEITLSLQTRSVNVIENTELGTVLQINLK